MAITVNHIFSLVSVIAITEAAGFGRSVTVKHTVKSQPATNDNWLIEL